MSLVDLISLHDREPVKAAYSVYEGVLASAYAAVEETNDTLPLGLRVFQDTVREIVSRESSEPVAYRAVLTYLSTLQNYKTKNPTRHTDLLPAGHPLAAPAPRPVVASFLCTQPNVSDEDRPLLAAAISAEPNSAARLFNLTRLQAKGADESIIRMVSDADAVVSVEKN